MEHVLPMFFAHAGHVLHMYTSGAFVLFNSADFYLLFSVGVKLWYVYNDYYPLL